MKMRLLFASLCMTWTASLAVHAQSVSPLRQSAGSFGQNFLVRVQIANTYDTAQIGEIFLYDTDCGKTPVSRNDKTGAESANPDYRHCPV